MHINTHIAIGLILTSLLDYLFELTMLEFILIVFLSFICDFDVFFSKYAKDHNHRLLISHSIIPSLIIIIIGLALNWTALFFGGINYSIHIFIDTFDWGTNVFYFQNKQIGFKFLITKDEFENLPRYLDKYKTPASFFDEKYYNNKICLLFEILFFLLMIFTLLIFAIQYLFMIFLYFIGLYFHLHRHFTLREIEEDYKNAKF
ncbi:MAG: hypothetical protein ACFE9I_08975 [Candidatus Hermodarchaeota archaeon]